jgi:hypothetical protein
MVVAGLVEPIRYALRALGVRELGFRCCINIGAVMLSHGRSNTSLQYVTRLELCDALRTHIFALDVGNDERLLHGIAAERLAKFLI